MKSIISSIKNLFIAITVLLLSVNSAISINLNGDSYNCGRSYENLPKPFVYEKHFGMTSGEVWIAGGQGSLVLLSAKGEVIKDLIINPNIDFTNLYFVDTRKGWVVGTNGNIYNTINGGNTWNQQTSGVTSKLNSIKCKNSTDCWISTNDGKILTTNDGGGVWNKIEASTTKKSLFDVFFINDFIGWTVGEDGLVLKTTDSGKTWCEQNNNAENNTKDWKFVNFKNKEFGCIISTQTVSCTLDGGDNWSEFNINELSKANKDDNVVGPSIESIIFKNNHIFLLDRCGQDIISEDKGVTWKFARTE